MITFEDDVWPQVQLHLWKYTTRNAPINGIIWHATRGGQWYDGATELRAFRNWAASPNNRISDYAGVASYGIGPGICLRVVPDTYVPRWSSWPSDLHAVSVEVAQSNPGQGIEAETIERCVVFALEASATYGIALRRVTNVTNDYTWSGMVGHADTIQGRASGKTDPDEKFWAPFMARLEEVTAMFEDLKKRVDRIERVLYGHGDLRVTVDQYNQAVLRDILGYDVAIGQTVSVPVERRGEYLDRMENNMWLGLGATQADVARVKEKLGL